MKHWPLVEEQLKLAREFLPWDMRAIVNTYLDNNELGLALEVLENWGDTENIADAAFWRPVAKAAILMLDATYE